MRHMVYTNRACHNKRRSLRAVGIVVLSAVLVCIAAPWVPAATADAPRVRSTDTEILALIREGADRSTTFRGLVDAISGSDGIVYIEFGYCAFGHLNACLLPFMASSHGDRYLRILVIPDKNRRTHDQLLALIAHEMRHALEVLEHAEVIDVATMDAMYRKIGMPVAGQHSGYETSAARAAGDAVLAELLDKRRAPGRTSDDVRLTASLEAHSSR
jgi:hypothetical protein